MEVCTGSIFNPTSYSRYQVIGNKGPKHAAVPDGAQVSGSVTAQRQRRQKKREIGNFIGLGGWKQRRRRRQKAREARRK